ncbi:MAG: hypothetical protein K0R63_199 [Rickettsiales bacterium]|jgi:hypothetical protein|nr:hypothetical protein [Rickettsiales bacterium]
MAKQKNLELKRRVLELGLTEEIIAKYSRGDSNTAEIIIGFLEKLSAKTPAGFSLVKLAMADIANLSGEEIKAIGICLEAIQMPEGLSLPTLSIIAEFFRSRPKSVSVQEVMEQIRGLNQYQIRAVKLGLTRAELEGHNWEEVGGGVTTIYFLEKRLKGVSVQEAMEQIRGLSQYQIMAVKLGLTRAELEGHNWEEVGGGLWAFQFLAKRLKQDVSVQEAMEQIRGLDKDAINRIMNYQEKGIKELGLTPLQVSIRRFDQPQFDAIKAGKKYQEVMPEAYEAIRGLENYTEGAVKAILPQVGDAASEVAKLLSRRDGGRLVVNRASAQAADPNAWQRIQQEIEQKKKNPPSSSISK